MIELDTSALPGSTLKDTKDGLILTVQVSSSKGESVTITIIRKLA
ncbi:MAG: hypothetical protein ABSF91_11420 [Bacteroidota bacterium]|jgi:hypothetical protein